MTDVSKKALLAMVVSVLLWMAYPVVSNALVGLSSPLAVLVMVHGIALVGSGLLLCAVAWRRGPVRDLGRVLLAPGNLALVLATGCAVMLNHGFLYWALSLSEDWDVLAVMVFELWPMMFFLVDTLVRRRQKITPGEGYAVVLITFGFVAGYAWLWWDGGARVNAGAFQVGALAFVGAVCMALTSLGRVMLVQRISTQLDGGNQTLTACVTVEFALRMAALPVLVVLGFSELEGLGDIDTGAVYLALFAGLMMIAVGSMLCDFALVQSRSSMLALLWYCVPVGAVILLSLSRGVWPSWQEWVALLALVAVNLVIALPSAGRGKP